MINTVKHMEMISLVRYGWEAQAGLFVALPCSLRCHYARHYNRSKAVKLLMRVDLSHTHDLPIEARTPSQIYVMMSSQQSNSFRVRIIHLINRTLFDFTVQLQFHFFEDFTFVCCPHHCILFFRASQSK